MNDRVLTAQLQRPVQAALSPWLVRFQDTQQPALRLFCFPYAGGSASLFRNWRATLDPQIEVIGVQLPGRGMRWEEAPAVDFGLLANLVTDAIVRVAGSVRFGFFGHSMGALLMFEPA